MIEYNQIFKLPEYYVKYKIAEFLLEDIPDGDVTTNALFSKKENGTAIIQAEEDLIFAGDQILHYFFDDTFKCGLYYSDGQHIPKGEIIGLISGRTDLILSRERTLLNLLQKLCGIASTTKKFVEIAKKYEVKILDTRKTTPGLRIFEKYAVVVGGGHNHRLDLSSGILIKDNHIKSAGGVKQAIDKIKVHNEKNLKIEIEVENIDEIKEGLSAGVDGFLLDNMPPASLVDIVQYIRLQPNGTDIFLEASGGITLDNLEQYAQTGVNAISCGALTHSAKSVNIHMEFM